MSNLSNKIKFARFDGFFLVLYYTKFYYMIFFDIFFLFYALPKYALTKMIVELYLS